MENKADNFTVNLSKLVRFFERTKSGYAFATTLVQGHILHINNHLNEELRKKNINIEFVNFDPLSEFSLLEQLKQKLNNNTNALVVNNFAELLFAFGENGQNSTIDATIELNFSRENLFKLEVPVLFWLTNEFIGLISNKAADLYSQRSISTVYFDSIPNEDTNNKELETFFEPKFRKTTNNQGIELKVKLLQKQLQDAENKKKPSTDIANRLALPLAKTYAKLDLHRRSLNLINKYKEHINRKNLQILLTLAKVLKKANKHEEAISIYEEAITLAKFENNIEGEALSKYSIAGIYLEKGQKEEALKYFEEYNLLFQKLYEKNPQNEGIKNSLAISYSKVGDIYQETGQYEKAIKYFWQETELFSQLYDNNPKNESIKNGLAISYSKLGYAYQAIGEFNKAVHFIEQDIKLTLELEEVNPDSENIKNALAISYERLGDIYQALGQLKKALHYFKLRAEIGKDLYENFPKNINFMEGLAVSNYKLAMIYKELNEEQNGLIFFEDWKKRVSFLIRKAPKSSKYTEWNEIEY